MEPGAPRPRMWRPHSPELTRPASALSGAAVEGELEAALRGRSGATPRAPHLGRRRACRATPGPHAPPSAPFPAPLRARFPPTLVTALRPLRSSIIAPGACPL